MDEYSKKRTISVNGVLPLLGVSKSGYYSWKKRSPSKQAIRKATIKKEIIEVYHESNQIYGAPKITKKLQEKGITVCEKTVGKYMREEGIQAIWVRPYVKTTIHPDFDQKFKNILNRNFTPNQPNAVWVTDITYIYTLEGFVYLTCVMDLFSRKIIGWHLSDRLTTEGVLKAITKAKFARETCNPVIIHSDRGCQFVSEAYLEATPATAFIHSYSRKGNPWGNACIESFHALIKREWLNRFLIKNREHAHALIFQYIESFYNTVELIS